MDLLIIKIEGIQIIDKLKDKKLQKKYKKVSLN